MDGQDSAGPGRPRPFPGLTDESWEGLRRVTRDWSGRGPDPDRDLWEAKECCPSLRIEGGHLLAETAPVSITHLGYTYEFGTYRVDMGPVEAANRNLTDKYDLRIFSDDPSLVRSSVHGTYYHPHIYTNGRGCWGALGRPYSVAIREGRYGDAMDLVQNFLGSLGYEHGICDIRLWQPDAALCSNCGTPIIGNHFGEFCKTCYVQKRQAARGRQP